MFGRPKSFNRLSRKRGLCPIYSIFFVEYMGRARSLDKLSSEWDRVNGSEHIHIYGF